MPIAIYCRVSTRTQEQVRLLEDEEKAAAIAGIGAM